MIIQTENGAKLELADGSTPAQIDDAVSHFQSQDLSLVDSLKKDYAARDAEIQKSVDATAAGQQGEVQMGVQNALSNASKFTDTAGELLTRVPVVGDIAKGVGGAINATGTLIGKTPLPASTGYNTVGDMVNSDTPTGRNLRAAGQAVNLTGSALGVRSVGNAAVAMTPAAISAAVSNLRNNPTVAARAAAGQVTKADEPSPLPNAAQAKAIAGENYDTANYLGAKFSAEEVAKPFIQAVEDTKPKPIAGTVMTAEDTKLSNSLSDYSGLKGKELSLDDVNRIDQTLTNKINQNHIDPRTGAPDAMGLQLMQLQTKLRNAVENVPDQPGNVALTNGRNAWAAQARMNDLNIVADRASVAPNKANALQSGYRALYNDKDRIRSWPKPAVEALKVAATPGIGDQLLSVVTSRLPALIGMGSGDFTGAAGLQLGNFAAGGVKEAILAKRGMKVQNAIGQDLVNKLRPVNVPAPEYAPQGLLPAPGRATLSNDEAAQMASKLYAPKTGGVPITDPQATSGPVVTRPPVSQLTNLQESLNPSRQTQLKNLANQLRTGGLSQNKFVQTSKTSFGLNTQQARSLAKEIINKGRK